MLVTRLFISVGLHGIRNSSGFIKATVRHTVIRPWPYSCTRSSRNFYDPGVSVFLWWAHTAPAQAVLKSSGCGSVSKCWLDEVFPPSTYPSLVKTHAWGGRILWRRLFLRTNRCAQHSMERPLPPVQKHSICKLIGGGMQSPNCQTFNL